MTTVRETPRSPTATQHPPENFGCFKEAGTPRRRRRRAQRRRAALGCERPGGRYAHKSGCLARARRDVGISVGPGAAARRGGDRLGRLSRRPSRLVPERGPRRAAGDGRRERRRRAPARVAWDHALGRCRGHDGAFSTAPPFGRPARRFRRRARRFPAAPSRLILSSRPRDPTRAASPSTPPRARPRPPLTPSILHPPPNTLHLSAGRDGGCARRPRVDAAHAHAAGFLAPRPRGAPRRHLRRGLRRRLAIFAHARGLARCRVSRERRAAVLRRSGGSGRGPHRGASDPRGGRRPVPDARPVPRRRRRRGEKERVDAAIVRAASTPVVSDADRTERASRKPIRGRWGAAPGVKARGSWGPAPRSSSPRSARRR